MQRLLGALMLCQGGLTTFACILQWGFDSLPSKACLDFWPPVGTNELYMEWILCCVTHQLIHGLSFVQINTSAVYL